MMASSAGALSILHVVAPAEFGGLESVVRLLACGQRRMGNRVCVAAVGVPRDPSHPFVGPLLEAGVGVECLERPGRAYHRERSWVAQVSQRFNASIMHTHGFRPDVVDTGVARSLGIPVVSTAHGISGEGLKVRAYYWLQWRSLRRVSAVIAVSRPLVQTLTDKRIKPERVLLLPNAYDGSRDSLDREAARRALGAPDDRFLIGWVGRLSVEKGADVLLESLAVLRDPRFHVVIVGDGPERDNLQQRAVALRVHEQITWCGAVRDAGRLFAAFDGFALTSRSEGTPIVLFEAMAAGVPIVATRVGGVPDVVSEREAMLVQPEAPEAVAAALASTADDPKSARNRAVAARQRLGAEYGVE
ncbi:MAG: glycosyltransferase, partial [Gemmatimonadaceae bacterium]